MVKHLNTEKVNKNVFIPRYNEHSQSYPNAVFRSEEKAMQKLQTGFAALAIFKNMRQILK